MSKDVEYRILERKTDGGWVAFAAAYRLGSQVVLFAPGWRSQRKLPVASLSELGPDQYPSSRFAYRWSGVKMRREVSDPVELLEEACAARPLDYDFKLAPHINAEGRMRLLVTDLCESSNFFDFVNFEVCPESRRTVIPRRLVGQHAFPPREASKGYCVVVNGPGEPIVGREFSVCLSLAGSAGPETSKGSKLDIVVADTWENDYGLLGKDALSQVMGLVPSPSVALFNGRAE